MTQHREIAYRGLRLRKATEGDGRTIEGVAVPFGDIYNDPWEGAETFDRDTVFDNSDTAKLCYQHNELIGPSPRQRTATTASTSPPESPTPNWAATP